MLAKRYGGKSSPRFSVTSSVASVGKKKCIFGGIITADGSPRNDDEHRDSGAKGDY